MGKQYQIIKYNQSSAVVEWVKVYLAKQFTIDREVAIKILDPSLSGNPQFRERFINEANALAKLSHPNIVSIYDFIEFEGIIVLLWSMLMELPLMQ
ncbi:MAG: protein kinase [Ignavibacteria bacterium]|nr:protein kinase [Ignavibacteria bacterium]